MKIYLAGKYTDDPNARQKFAWWRRAVRYFFDGDVVVPTDIVPEGANWKDAMRICLNFIRHAADMVAMLPDWTESRGATIEEWYARRYNKRVVYLESSKREFGNED